MPIYRLPVSKGLMNLVDGLIRNKFLLYHGSLKTRLISSNAKYISDAMLTISRRLPSEIFLKHYSKLVRNEQFQKLSKSNDSRIQSRFYREPCNSLSVLCRTFVI